MFSYISLYKYRSTIGYRQCFPTCLKFSLKLNFTSPPPPLLIQGLRSVGILARKCLEEGVHLPPFEAIVLAALEHSTEVKFSLSLMVIACADKGGGQRDITGVVGSIIV